MSAYPRLLARLRSARWSIQPAALQAIYDSLGAHLRGAPALGRARALFDHDDDAADQENKSGAANAPKPRESVHVIPVHGIIGRNLSSLDTMCGGCDVLAIEAAVGAAVADPLVQAIVLDLDSPGGVVTGVPELTEKLRAWNAQKPLYAFTGSLCASAAYWLASACTAIFATPTADLGSIGVYIALVDDTEWWQQEGLKLELIKAGEFKAMGHPGKSLTAEERALLQADVDAIYAMFTADVRAGRPGAKSAVMQGQTFLGAAAVAAKLADALVPDLSTVTLALTTALRRPAA